jgi:stress-induced-phosphoprotein 1
MPTKKRLKLEVKKTSRSEMTAVGCKEKGNEFLKTKDFDSAISWYTLAIAKDGTQHVFYSNRSAAYSAKGDFQHAVNDGNLCIQLKPDWVKGYNRKGCALYAMKKYDEAIATFKDGLKVDRTSPLLTGPIKAAETAKQNAEKRAAEQAAKQAAEQAARRAAKRADDPDLEAALNLFRQTFGDERTERKRSAKCSAAASSKKKSKSPGSSSSSSLSNLSEEVVYGGGLSLNTRLEQGAAAAVDLTQ